MKELVLDYSTFSNSTFGLLSFYYTSLGTGSYSLYSGENNLLYTCPLIEPTNISDFELNYKSSGISVDSKDIAIAKIFSRVGGEVSSFYTYTTSPVSNNLIFEEMNVSTGGVAPGTTIGNSFTDIYNYSGQGLLYGYTLNLEKITNSEWKIKMTIDSTKEIFGSSGLSIAKVTDPNLYNLGNNNFSFFGINVSGKSFCLNFPYSNGLTYNSSIRIQLSFSGQDNATFRSGLIKLTKE